ncbi:MAG: RpiB/LacA/LacB family sugar-phosphate isomerase [Candidatus Harrisonbacteria bacterium]|nr:RpiB/LacA/LacB family sugar-phosphate isomerase [Candidatus Harrisonbacteria bacterium]
MLVYIGADHRGFPLKESLKKYLQENGYEAVDVGNKKLDPKDDYPDFASKVAKEVSLDPEHSRGIVICGSGVGVDVVANKYPNVRSALAATPDQAMDSRNDDDTNVLALAANYLSEDEALKITEVWLQTDFSEEERHWRRLGKIEKIEDKL